MIRYVPGPLIAVAWQDAESLAQRLSGGSVRYCLPSEAQWEKAARTDFGFEYSYPVKFNEWFTGNRFTRHLCLP